MDTSCLVSTVQAGGCSVMVWGIYSWHTLGPLVPIEHSLNATAYLSIVADHVHPFMTTVYPSSDGYFQQDNVPCHKAQIISDWFLEHDNEFILIRSQFNRAPLGCGGTGDSHHGRAAEKSAAITFTFMHLADAFIQSDLQFSSFRLYIFCQYVCSLGIEPTTFALLTQCSNH